MGLERCTGHSSIRRPRAARALSSPRPRICIRTEVTQRKGRSSRTYSLNWHEASGARCLRSTPTSTMSLSGWGVVSERESGQRRYVPAYRRTSGRRGAGSICGRESTWPFAIPRSWRLGWISWTFLRFCFTRRAIHCTPYVSPAAGRGALGRDGQWK